MVTASLPAFAKPGQTIDVTVSSMGNAKSLRGGTLLMTPLKGADGQVYAMAQGNVLVGGAGASASGGSSVQVNHLSVGRISAGATVERAVATPLGQGDHINLELNTTDFTTTRRIVDAINSHFVPGTAMAVDGRVIRVQAPTGSDERVAFLSQIESLDVTPAQTMAKVIVNARTGSVVMNQSVTLEACAVAHGNLSVIISSEPVISQPAPFSPLGQTVQTENDADRDPLRQGRSGDAANQRVAGRGGEGAERDRRHAPGPARDPAGDESGRLVARRTGNHLDAMIKSF